MVNKACLRFNKLFYQLIFDFILGFVCFHTPSCLIEIVSPPSDSVEPTQHPIPAKESAVARKPAKVNVIDNLPQGPIILFRKFLVQGLLA